MRGTDRLFFASEHHTFREHVRRFVQQRLAPHVDQWEQQQSFPRDIYGVCGDAGILDRVIPRLRPGGEVVLAGFYKEQISFAYAPAFMREAQIRVAAEWKRADLLAVTELVHTGVLNLDGLITHTQSPGRAHDAYEVAFGDPECLKMVLDWRH